MAFSLDLKPNTGGQNLDPGEYTDIYGASGETNRGTVMTISRAIIPPTVITSAGTLYLQTIRVDPDGYNQFTVTAPYGKQKKQAGSWSFSFDTTGGTTHVKASKEHIASYGAGDLSNPHSGAIGVKADKTVEGVDIVIPALKFNVEFKHPAGIITTGFAKLLASVSGKTNSDTFLDFEPGELLFLGAAGSGGSEAETSINYQFIASANVTDLEVGGITISSKKGHEYVWLEFESDTDAEEAACVKPTKAHVERVYDEVSFADTFGWS